MYNSSSRACRAVFKKRYRILTDPKSPQDQRQYLKQVTNDFTWQTSAFGAERARMSVGPNSDHAYYVAKLLSMTYGQYAPTMTLEGLTGHSDIKSFHEETSPKLKNIDPKK
jgi:hypothetical protein